MTGQCRLRNEKLYDMYSSPNIRVIKSRMGWAGMWGVWKIGEAHIQFWWGDMRVTDHSEDLSMTG